MAKFEKIIHKTFRNFSIHKKLKASKYVFFGTNFHPNIFTLLHYY